MKRGVCATFILLLLVLAAQPTFVHSESPEEIRRRELQELYQELEERQDRIRNDLNVTRAEKDSLQKEVNQVRGQINYMESLIRSTETKIELTDLEIVDIQGNIGDTQKAIDSRRAAIGELIAIRDQQDQDGLLINLIRFERISDFFQQIQDVVTIHTRLLGIISELKGYRVALELDKTSLVGKKGSLEQLSADQEHQQYGLIVAKSAKDRVLRETKGKESEYQKQLTQIEKEKETLFKELRELELKIIHGGLYIVHITAESVPPPGTHIFHRPDGLITQGFGMTHYARHGAYGGAPHNGVDIASGYGNPIRSIGDGRIVANGSNDGWGNWVAIQHNNNMVSVYAHMSSFTGSIGQQVSVRQVIGYEGSTGKSSGAHLHLSLYRDFFTYINDKNDELYFNYFDGTVSPCQYMNCG